jgi:hypothetical protein
LGAHLHFHASNQPRQRRLGDSKPIGSTAKVHFLGERDEIPKSAEVKRLATDMQAMLLWIL